MKTSTAKSFVIALVVAGLTCSAPMAGASSEPFIGEIDWVGFNFAPRGWAFCDGQLLPIAQNNALFSLLGTTYGGDGRTSFGLPDVRSRVMVHEGQGAGLSSRGLGERSGAEQVTLTEAEMHSHTHTMRGSSGNAQFTMPANKVLATKSRTTIYGDTANVDMDSSAMTSTGGGQPHNNMQPYTVLNCIIALQGIFPSRN